MEIISIKADNRADVGGTNSKNVRNEGRIPAVVYGGGSVDHISVTKRDVKNLIYTPDFKIAELDIAGKTQKCILKEVQYHPVTDNIVHIDFLRLIDGTPVKVEIPVRFKGVSPGVKEGGSLVQSMRKVKVKVNPEHLVDSLFCDISELKLGFSVRVKDLETNDNMEVLSPMATPVAGVEVPRALRSKDAEAEAEAGVVAPTEAEDAAAE